MLKKIGTLSKLRIQNSRIVLTEFDKNIDDALTYITGVMVSEGIPVDNNYGLASLQELCAQIDQRSEKVVKEESDYEFKKFTSSDLSTIFNHSYKVENFNAMLKKLEYTIAKENTLKKRRVNVAAIYRSYYEEAKKVIEELDIMNLSEKEVLEITLDKVNFVGVPDDLDKEVIVLDAFSQILFEMSRK